MSELFLIIYLFASVVVIALGFLSYKLGRESTSTTYEKRYRIVKWFGYLNIIYFIVLIPVFDDGSLVRMLLNVLNIVLSGLAGYGYIVSYLNGVHEREGSDHNY